MANIMIVDDAAFMRMVMKDVIIHMGHVPIVEAVNGADAVKKYAEHKPDLVTMDITMPEMDGVEAVTEIKKINPNAKIIMCSAMGQQAMVVNAIQAGACDFIVKPIQKERVIEAINKVIRSL